MQYVMTEMLVEKISHFRMTLKFKNELNMMISCHVRFFSLKQRHRKTQSSKSK